MANPRRVLHRTTRDRNNLVIPGGVVWANLAVPKNVYVIRVFHHAVAMRDEGTRERQRPRASQAGAYVYQVCLPHLARPQVEWAVSSQKHEHGDWTRAMRLLGRVEDPTLGLRPCTQPGCPELVEHGRCARHVKAPSEAVLLPQRTSAWCVKAPGVIEDLCCDSLKNACRLAEFKPCTDRFGRAE